MALKAFNKLQLNFLREYCADPKIGVVEAVRRPGYSPKRAKITAIEVMKHPGIREEIERRLTAKVEQASLSPESVIADLSAIDKECKSVGASAWALTLRLKVAELRAKILRMAEEKP